MKQYIKKIIGVFALITMLYSCDTTNESGYEPALLTEPAAFTITAPAAMVMDSEFVVTYTPTAAGEGYLVAVLSGSAAPTSTDVNDGTGLVAGNFSVDGTTPVNFTIDKDLFGGNTYDVYAIHKSESNFISETVQKLSVTTLNTVKPSITAMNPEFQAANLDFDNQTVTFTFDEPVKYVSGTDITITLFENGVGTNNQFVLTNPTIELGGTVIGDAATEITISGWNGLPDNFTIVSFADGTFVDQGNLAADGIALFDYYFSSRARTQEEVTALLIADWTYEILNDAFSPAVLSSTTGNWTVTAGTKPNTIILSNQVDHDINAFLSVDDADTKEFEVTVGENVGGIGNLYMAPAKSGINAVLFADGADVYWTPYYERVTTPADLNLVGQYDLNAKTMHFRLDIGDALGFFATANYFGDITYNYTYVAGSGDLGKADSEFPIPSDIILKSNGTASQINVFSLDYLLNLQPKKRVKIDHIIAQ